MRFIKVSKLQSIFDARKGNWEFQKWCTRAQGHLSEITNLSPSERSKYWANNNIWSELYFALSELSGHKCWYSEAKENSCEFQIDHFRPKALSKNHDWTQIHEYGYWWLSYSWENFRLAWTLVNYLRKDRFSDSEEVYGKGVFFPLDLLNGPKASVNDLYCNCEKKLLLDPTIASDIIKISFDVNGESFPTYTESENPEYYLQWLYSIKYYWLNHASLIRGRQELWTKCDLLVKRTYNDIQFNIKENKNLINPIIDSCINQIAEIWSFENQFSMVVRNYVQLKHKEPGYWWLEQALQTI